METPSKNPTPKALQAAEKASRELEQVSRTVRQVEGRVTENLVADALKSVRFWSQKVEQPDWVKVEQSYLREVEQAADALKRSQRRWFANAIDDWKSPKFEIAWQPKPANLSKDWAASFEKFSACNRSFEAVDLGQHLVALHTAELNGARRSKRVRENGMSGWFEEFLRTPSITSSSSTATPMPRRLRRPCASPPSVVASGTRGLARWSRFVSKSSVAWSSASPISPSRTPPPVPA